MKAVKFRLLIVDDSGDFLRDVSEKLDKRGVEVKTLQITSPNSATDIINDVKQAVKEFKPNAVAMDVQLSNNPTNVMGVAITQALGATPGFWLTAARTSPLPESRIEYPRVEKQMNIDETVSAIIAHLEERGLARSDKTGIWAKS